MDKSQLLVPRTKTAEVEIPDVGVVTVRGMSRWEALEANKRLETKGILYQERFILAACMVDPALTEEDVAAWQKASPPDEINQVALEINRLSGVTPEAAKEAYKSLRGDPGTGV